MKNPCISLLASVLVLAACAGKLPVHAAGSATGSATAEAPALEVWDPEIYLIALQDEKDFRGNYFNGRFVLLATMTFSRYRRMREVFGGRVSPLRDAVLRRALSEGIADSLVTPPPNVLSTQFETGHHLLAVSEPDSIGTDTITIQVYQSGYSEVRYRSRLYFDVRELTLQKVEGAWKVVASRLILIS